MGNKVDGPKKVKKLSSADQRKAKKDVSPIFVDFRILPSLRLRQSFPAHGQAEAWRGGLYRRRTVDKLSPSITTWSWIVCSQYVDCVMFYLFFLFPTSVSLVLPICSYTCLHTPLSRVPSSGYVSASLSLYSSMAFVLQRALDLTIMMRKYILDVTVGVKGRPMRSEQRCSCDPPILARCQDSCNLLYMSVTLWQTSVDSPTANLAI